MNENKNQDWMSIFNDPLNQNHHGNDLTTNHNDTNLQNTSNQAETGTPGTEIEEISPQTATSNLVFHSQQDSSFSNIPQQEIPNFIPNTGNQAVVNNMQQPTVGTVSSQQSSGVQAQQSTIPKIDPIPNGSKVMMNQQVQQGIPEVVPTPQAFPTPQPTPDQPVQETIQQNSGAQGIPELNNIQQPTVGTVSSQQSSGVQAQQSTIPKIDPFPKVSQEQVNQTQQGIPEIVPTPPPFPSSQEQTEQQTKVTQISNNPGIEEPKKSNFPHYENSPSAEKEQKKLRKLMDRPNTRIRRRHRLLLPMIIFLLIVCIGGYFTLNSYGIFGGSSLTCTRTSTAGNVEEILEYHFSFENNKLKTISYQSKYNLLAIASDIERYNFESNKNGVELLSNTYSSLSGVTYTPEVSDNYYQVKVELDLSETDTQTNITLSGFEDRLSLDTTRQDVLDVVGRERYVCE